MKCTYSRLQLVLESRVFDAEIRPLVHSQIKEAPFHHLSSLGQKKQLKHSLFTSLLVLYVLKKKTKPEE